MNNYTKGEIAVGVLISGKVQGVGYRFSTQLKARQLGIRGWVRNLADGKVETVFEGSSSLVEQMVKWCHLGPSAAVVDNVTVEEIEFQGLQKFEIRSSHP